MDSLKRLTIVFTFCITIAQAQNAVQKDATVLGFKLHYQDAGRGPVVVLLHGLGGDGSRWAPNIGPLSREFRVIALDQIGFGQSDKPLANYHTGMLSEFLARFLATIGVSKASLVGNSMGASVALYTAVHYPQVVDRLVLADCACLRAVGAAASAPAASHRRDIQNGVTSEETRDFFRILFHDKSLVTDKVVEDNLVLRLQSAFAISKIQESGARGLGSISQEQAHGVNAPTLIIWGKFDQLDNPALADLLAETIPRSRKVLIDDSGHMPQLEKPAEFNRIVTEFLKQQASLTSERAH
jgi:2-hydroxy-6-oxonona-2,4-dienedioate hydrolase